MEGVHNHQPKGARNEITDHDEPIVHDGRTTGTLPPLTFNEAVSHSPHELLRELHDHALTIDIEGERLGDPRHHLAELALSAAVVWWWNHWQPIMMHRALQAGASLSEVAAAAGAPELDVYDRWSNWAERQSGVMIGDRPAVDPAEADAVRNHIRRTSGADVLALLEGPER